MIRQTVYLDETQALRVRQVATERGISLSAVVRDAVDKHFAHMDAVARSLAACGRFRSGTGDVAARHDEYYADSILDTTTAGSSCLPAPETRSADNLSTSSYKRLERHGIRPTQSPDKRRQG